MNEQYQDIRDYSDSYDSELYFSAFRSLVQDQWTIFNEEEEDLAYCYALSALMLGGEIGVRRRRKLMYEAMKGYFQATNSHSIINKYLNTIPTSNKLIQKVIRNLCDVYSKGVERNLSNRFEGLLQDSYLDFYLQDLHEKSYFTSRALIRPYYKDGLCYNIWTPDIYRTKYDKYDNLVKVILLTPIYKNRKVNITRVSDIGHTIEYHYTVWELDGNVKVYQLDHSGRKTEFEFDGEVGFEFTTKYTKLPFVEMNAGNPADYLYSDGGDWNLAEYQIFINHLDFLIKNNSQFGNLAFWLAKNINLPSQIELSGNKMINVKTSAGDPDPEIDYKQAELIALQLSDVKEETLKQIYKFYGLPSMSVESTGALSGTAMKQDRIELMEFRQKESIKVKKFDKKLIETLQHILEKEAGISESIESYKLEIKDYDIVQDPEEVFTVAEMKYNAGLMTKLDFLRATGKQGSDKELQKYLEEVENERSSTISSDSQSEAETMANDEEGESFEGET